MPARASRCGNWDPGTCGKHQNKNEKFLVCQQGLVGAHIGWDPQTCGKHQSKIQRGMPAGAGRCRKWDPGTLRVLISDQLTRKCMCVLMLTMCSYVDLCVLMLTACSYARGGGQYALCPLSFIISQFVPPTVPLCALNRTTPSSHCIRVKRCNQAKPYLARRVWTEDCMLCKPSTLWV